MKKLIILITAVISLNVLASTEIKTENKVSKTQVVSETSLLQPQPVMMENFLIKPAVKSLGLFQVAMLSACRQECEYEFDLCIDSGDLRIYCRMAYLQCITQNCP